VLPDGGLSRIYNRYRLVGDPEAPATATAPDTGRAPVMHVAAPPPTVDTQALATILHAHANEIQRRGLTRVDEALSLLYEGATRPEADMWGLIAQVRRALPSQPPSQAPSRPLSRPLSILT
jgi:hypothetical protein